MRMITHDEVRHNVAPPRSIVLPGMVLVFLALTLAACSADKEPAENQNATVEAENGNCRLTTDISAWNAFKVIADRVAGGENVPLDDFYDYAELPTLTLWRESLEQKAPPAQRIAKWLEGVFWEEMGRKGEQKRSPDRTDYLHNCNYSLQNRERIDARLAELAGPRKCEMDELIRYWTDAENLPGDITIHFLPAKPEIRILEGNLFVDTGVLAAGSVDQIIGSSASLLYRRYQAIPGTNPMELEGELSVAQAFRVLVNEGVIGWIDQAASLEFDKNHPALYKVNLIPENFFLKAQEALGLINRQLGKMLDDEADMNTRGRFFAEHLAAMNAFSQTGYGMSAVIFHRLGKDRLKEASRSVPGFLATYQEAALLNPVPAPIPGTPGHELFETVPPLDPDLFLKLHAMLSRVFPEQE